MRLTSIRQKPKRSAELEQGSDGACGNNPQRALGSPLGLRGGAREDVAGGPVRSLPPQSVIPFVGSRRAHSVWIWDTAVLAYLLSGSPTFDHRLALTSSVSLNQVLGLVTLARVAWCIWQGRVHPIRARATLGSVLVLTLLLVVRLPGSLDPVYGSSKAIAHLVMILPALLYLETTLRTPADTKRLLFLMILAAVSLLALSVPRMWGLEGGQRLAVLGGGPNVFARLLGTGVLASGVLALGKRTREKQRFWRLAFLVGVAVGTLGVVLAGSKTVLFSLGVAFLILFWRMGARPITRGLFWGLPLLVLLPWITHPLVESRPKDGGIVRLLRRPDVDDTLGSYGSRLRYLRGSWEEMGRHPWFGVGTGGWSRQLGFEDEAEYPHNILLELGVEIGIVGLVLVLVPLLGFPIGRASPRGDESWMGAGLVSLAVFWCMNVQTSGDLVDSRYLWWHLALLEIHLRSSLGQTGDSPVPSGELLGAEA